MNVRDTIITEYSYLQDGEDTGQLQCPLCKGGSSGESSFGVSRRGNKLLWNCFRASCTCRGTYESGLVASGTGTPPSRRTRQERWNVPVEPVNQSTIRFLSARFGIDTETLNTVGIGSTGEGSEPYRRRLSYPILGPDARLRGRVHRSYEGATPKALTWLKEDEVPLAWYKFIWDSPVLVLTEDQVSAIKLAPHFHAAALLGTDLNEARINDIKTSGKQYERIYLALDRDATMSALRQQLELRHTLPNLNILSLPMDIKDMDKEEFETLLKRIT